MPRLGVAVPIIATWKLRRAAAAALRAVAARGNCARLQRMSDWTYIVLMLALSAVASTTMIWWGYLH
jgi:hypothetical protein